MQTYPQINISARLDTATQYVKQSLEATKAKWDEGTSRMRVEDITRAERYIKQLMAYCRDLKGTLRDFREIAPVIAKEK